MRAVCKRKLRGAFPGPATPEAALPPTSGLTSGRTPALASAHLTAAGGSLGPVGEAGGGGRGGQVLGRAQLVVVLVALP